LTAILASAALLRFWGLGVKQLWLDEIIQAIHARPGSLREILTGVARDRGGAPLDYLVQHLFLTFLPAPLEVAARVHAALFGVAAVAMVYFVCRKLLADDSVSLMAALLFAFYPFHHHYSQEGRPYSLFLLLTLCLYFLFLRLLEKQTFALWVTFTAVAAAGLYTHPYAALVLFSQFLILAIGQLLNPEPWRLASRRAAFFLLSTTLAAVAFLPWLAYSFDNAKGDAAERIDVGLLLRLMKELADGSYPLAVALIAFAGAGLLCLMRTRRTFAAVALLVWVAAPIPVIVPLLIWREYFFAARQLIFVTPAMIIAAAVGVDALRRKAARRWFIPEAALLVLCFAIIALHYPDRRDDLRGAARLLEGIARPGDEIRSPNLSGLLTFYCPDLYRYSRENTRGSRILYVDSRHNPDRSDLKRLLSRTPPLEKTELRGVTVYVFPVANDD
jgi:mannosyltransferase